MKGKTATEGTEDTLDCARDMAPGEGAGGRRPWSGGPSANSGGVSKAV